ncbi:hypothetical protein K7X08_033821 [Anisodus acutangulus]|uniref:Dehydrin n=1 Tax=Anisodus acutangulus TaxID=402998 RepID=A0A9Q1M7E0_9SOLA|nr:hypothetical protein K7X08_033821 [Anisodus acutangulus]
MAQHVTSQDQMHLVDEHGNPRVIAPTGAGGDAMKKEHEHHHHEGQQQLHHRSGSSSSSSSEDDGEGGRRKKGIKEKIKEKLTGDTTHDDKKELTDQQLPASQITTTSETAEGEKKGVMGKIKEKIPGMH